MPGSTCCHAIRPWVLALGVTFGFWVLLIVSAMLSWVDNHLASGVTFKLIPVYLHLGCLGVTCFIVSILDYLIFYKYNFVSWFSTLGFLFYIITQLIIVVNAFTMDIAPKTNFYIESVILFVLLCLYTQIVSWQLSVYRETQRRIHEEHIDKQITSVLTRKGRCVTIPLKGPLPTNPGTSSRR